MTEKPAADAVFVFGPHVLGSGDATHSQMGKPTKPTDPGAGSGAIPIVTPRNRI
ncbi:MAG: hypothetical protein ACYC1E_12655 [Propionibacteriaceae bacterium]